MEYDDTIRIARAKQGKSPCKPPYCTGMTCYRSICKAWDIFNQYRKDIGKNGKELSKSNK